ncbi:unnamed protein product [Calicophoron daubneyi]|uniref:Geminin n=1 Tax=Calicophoron daubneyi TaxID=300641 RepID=A0AAV2TS18_CALDB
MTSVRKGLCLRNSLLEEREMKPVKNLVKKPLAVYTKQSINCSEPAKIPFKIYEDPIQPRCQHCGAERIRQDYQTGSAKHKIEQISCGVQTSDTSGDLKEWLCSDNPPDGYWKELAESRRVALKETLDENKELCELIESLNKEIERLAAINSHTDEFVKNHLALSSADAN